jgi:hypothetical protein
MKSGISKAFWFSVLTLIPTIALAMENGPATALPLVGYAQAPLNLVPANDNVFCGHTDMPTTGVLRYCLQPGSRTHVIVSFPGVFNTEYAYLKETPTSLHNSYKSFGEVPTVFTMTIGRISFLTGATHSNGKTDVQEVLDAVSATLAKHGYPNLYQNPGTVDLLGESMGGHNTIMMYLRAPQLFRKFGLMCPALTTNSPFLGEPAWLAAMDPDADWYRSISYKASMVFFFGNEDAWNLASPLKYAAQSYRPLAKPGAIFISSVRTDYFGFNSGGQAFAAVMRAKGHVVQTHQSVNTQHCYIQTDALARFFVQ